MNPDYEAVSGCYVQSDPIGLPGLDACPPEHVARQYMLFFALQLVACSCMRSPLARNETTGRAGSAACWMSMENDLHD
jgi:hypothetical protein